MGLSILLKGTLQDKLRWTFQLYDVNKDGVLSRSEFRDVTASVRMLTGIGSCQKLGMLIRMQSCQDLRSGMLRIIRGMGYCQSQKSVMLIIMGSVMLLPR